MGSDFENPTFQEFFTKWKDEQNRHLQTLIASSKTSQQEQSLRNLVGRVISHYEEYYRVKSKWAKTEVLLMMSAPWTTPLEAAYLWVGGWRPTAAFHLLYSKSGLQFEAGFSNFMAGRKTGDLGDLTSGQMDRIDKLQRKTIKEEREIAEKAAKQQERVADVDMVELSGLTRLDVNRVGSTLKPKELGFQKILQSADDLRLRTLKGVIDILSPIQAVHFLIAAAELHLKIHDLGKEKEEERASPASNHW